MSLTFQQTIHPHSETQKRVETNVLYSHPHTDDKCLGSLLHWHCSTFSPPWRMFDKYRISYKWWWLWKLVNHFGKYWKYEQKLNWCKPMTMKFTIPHVTNRNLCICHQSTNSRIYLAELFIIAPNRKPPTCASGVEKLK